MYHLLRIKYVASQNIKLLVWKSVDRAKFKYLHAFWNDDYAILPHHETNHELISVPNMNRSVTQRLHSTTTNMKTVTTKLIKKRRRKISYAKYVDLLEVTDRTVNERKSRVKRLKAEKLQNFVDKTQDQINENLMNDEQEESERSQIDNELSTTDPSKEIAFEEGYKNANIDALNASLIRTGGYDDKPLIFFGNDEYSRRVYTNKTQVEQILRDFNNFREIIEAIEHEEYENGDSYNSYAKITTNEELTGPLDYAGPYIYPELKERGGDVIPLLTNDLNDSRKTNLRFKSKIHKNEQLERLAKERALHINLNTYLNVCISLGMLNRALSTLLSYSHRTKNSKCWKKSLITIDLYNILLHGYAEKGSFERFARIFTILEEDGLQFNEQTFAAIFECLGRMESSKENKKNIEKYITISQQMGFTLDQIMNRSKFIADQRDMVLVSIRHVQPNFTPIYESPPSGYANPLLNHLNEYNAPTGLDSPPNNQDLHISKSEIKTYKLRFSNEQLQQMARDQLKVEISGFIKIKSIEKYQAFGNVNYFRKKLKEIEDVWRLQIYSAIHRDLNTLRAQMRFKPHGYMSYYTYLKSIEPSQYVDILIKEIYKLGEASETYSPTVGQLHKELGEQVQTRYQIEQKKKNGTLEKVGEIYNAYCQVWNSDQNIGNSRQIWQKLVQEKRFTGPSMDLKDIAWPTNVLTGVGRFLYNILMHDIKINAHIIRQSSKNKKQNILPAFYTLFRNHGRLVKEEVKPHPLLARILRASQQQTLTFDSNVVPMLCPPQPWSTPFNGGYLLNKSELIRLPHQAIQQWERIRNANPQHLYPALDSLNQLASIPWRVNTDVLDIITKVFQRGGEPDLNVPQPPSSLPPLQIIQQENNSLSSADRAKLFKEKLRQRRRKAEMYSLWCDTLYRLSLAEHYRDKVFWLPHNMDFRGRVYPIPPHLNHLGSDLARSMLIFDQPQPLGADGFNWLKLHCINLTGLKKRDSVHDRLLFAEKELNNILDSADNPLTGYKWWMKSDEPWQTLACCIEIAKVHRSPNPSEYLSRFPVHQDGSCNGLQHYAALGRDTTGAISVNLAPSQLPQDVYSTVAELVEKSRINDARNGLQVALALESYVRRKVIKQTVMTTVYGVTRYGARLQIARQLKDIENFPKEWVWPASTYLTTKTFEILREMFTSTREIQDWFTDCARMISSVRSQNVEWITPLGLPIVQPYNRQELKQTLRTGSRICATMSTDMFERPNVMKQKNAFPPNFIHSLDSSHMMLTSLHCERKGLTFVSVHDCFWTHACTVPDMNKICREQFVSLHSQPILENLTKHLIEKYSFKKSDFSNNGSSADLSKEQLNRVLLQMPKKGDFDLQYVLDSVYFFS